jgi:acyl-CoA reductase-like NAD-dependent aldehyde dehydrogenase
MAEPALWLYDPEQASYEGQLRITDPRDGSLVGEVQASTLGDLHEALHSARAAFPGWRAVASADRCAALHAAADAVHQQEGDLAGFNLRETGKPYEEALAGVRAGIGTLRQYAEYAPLHRGHSLNGATDAVDFSRAEPRGVAVVLTPWNDPVAVACGLIGAALAMGNTVVYKPSERCPHTGVLLGDLLAGAFPAGVMHTVIGSGRAGTALIERTGVDIVAHVGSTATGEAIARLVAGTQTHVIRENGGNDPLIVDADVDPTWAAEQAATGAYANAGQICTSVERIYVHRSIADRFTAALVRRTIDLNESGSLAPLVDDKLRYIVNRQVESAIADGAVAAVGGAIPTGPGAHYPATVLTGCTAGMQIMREETFGPVAPIQVAENFDDAIRLACADRYGLAASVLTGSLEHALLAAERLPVGTVKINGVFGGAPGGSAQPRGASGAGFGYGPGLLDEMSTTKVVHIERGLK